MRVNRRDNLVTGGSVVLKIMTNTLNIELSATWIDERIISLVFIFTK